MISVLVQIWGPVWGPAEGAYNWVTVGKIDDPDNLDVDFLKPRVMEIINNREYKPNTNAARLKIIRDGKDEMKVTLMDLW